MNKYLYLRHLKRTLVLALIFQFLTIPLYPSVAVSRVYAITIGECFNLVANGDLDPSTDCASYAQPAPPPSEPEPVYTPPAPDEPPAPVYQQPRYNPPPRYTPPVYEPDPVYEEPQPDPIIEPETPAQTEPVYTQEPIAPVTKSAYEACLEEHPYDEYCDRVFFGQSEQTGAQPVTEEPGLGAEGGEKTWWETATEWPSEAWEWIKETAAESGQSISEVIEGSGDKIASLFGSNDDSSGNGSGVPAAPQPQDPEWATKIAAAQSDWEIYKTQAASEDPALAAQTRAQTIAALGLPPESTDAEVMAALNKGLENSGLKFSGTPSDMTVEAGEPVLTEDDSDPGSWAAAGMVARLADGFVLNGVGGVVYDFVYGTGEEARDSALSFATGGGSDAIKSAIASGQEWKETADNLDELVFNKPEVWSALRDDPTIYDEEGNILMPELARATRRYYQIHGTPEEKAIAENAVNSSEEAESKQTEGIAQAGALAAGLFMGGAAGGGIKGALANLYLPIGVDDAVINFANAKNEARIANAIPEAKAPTEVAQAPVKSNEAEVPVKEAPVKEIASAADEPEGATWYKPWTWFNGGKTDAPEENLAVRRETEDPQLADSALKTKPIQGAPEPPAVARAEPELPKSEPQVPAKVQEPEAQIPDEVDSELAIPVEQKPVSIEEARSARPENPVKPAEEEVTVPRTEPQEPTPIRPQEEDVPAKLPCAASLPLRFQLVKVVFAAEPCSVEQIAALEVKNEEAQVVLDQASKKIEGELRSNVEPYRQEADDIQARIFEYENREVRQNGRPRQEVRSDPEYLGLRQQLIDASNKANQAEEDLVQSLKGDYLDLKQEAVKARDELDAGIASRGETPLGYTDPDVKAKTEEVLSGFGLKDDDLVYRTVPAQYVKDGEIEAVISPTALIKNVYGNDELIQSWQLAGPGLNVTRTNKGNYGANNPGNVVVGIKVADLKAAGAKFYPDEGSLVDDALMVELPGSKVKVARVYDNPVKSAFYDAGDWLKGNIQRPVANAADSLLQRVGLKEAPVSKIADVPESKIGSGVEAGRSDDLAGKGEGDVSAPCPIPPQASLFNFVKEVYAAGPCPVKVSGANAEANPTYHTADDRKLEFKEKGGVVMDGMSNEGKGSGGVAADKASPVLAKIDNLPREGDPNIIAGQMEAIFEEADRVVSNDPGTYRLPGGYTLTPNATLDPSGKPVVTRSGSTFNGTRGTTATSTIIVHHNGREYAVTAYVGDSPAYIKRGDQLIKLTPNPEGVAGNVLGNYIGVSRRGRPFKVQTTIQELLPGDQILIASDGVSIPDSHIRGIMNSNPRDAAAKIVKASKDAGQKDDVTAVLIKPEVGASAPQTYSPYRRGGQPAAARPAPAIAASNPTAVASNPSWIQRTGEWISERAKPILATTGVITAISLLTEGTYYLWHSINTVPPVEPKPMTQPAQSAAEKPVVPDVGSAVQNPNQSQPQAGQKPPSQSTADASVIVPEMTKVEKEVQGKLLEASQKATPVGNSYPSCTKEEPGGESIIAQNYSDGSRVIIANYGVVPGECKNPKITPPKACQDDPGGEIILEKYTQCGGGIGLEDTGKYKYGYNYDIAKVYRCQNGTTYYKPSNGRQDTQNCGPTQIQPSSIKLGDVCSYSAQCKGDNRATCDTKRFADQKTGACVETYLKTFKKGEKEYDNCIKNIEIINANNKKFRANDSSREFCEYDAIGDPKAEKGVTWSISPEVKGDTCIMIYKKLYDGCGKG